MNSIKNIYELLPNAVYITDAYGYVLEINSGNPFEQIKAGSRLSKVIPGFPEDRQGEIKHFERVYQWTSSEVLRADTVVGYTVMLMDITVEDNLSKRSALKSREIKELIEKQKEANAQLELLALEVKQLSDYSEQLRIARSIHDNSGHALTALHTICGMCNTFKDTDSEKYLSLIDEGLMLCRQERRDKTVKSFDSVLSILEYFKSTSPFPINCNITGEEPDFIKDKYELIYKIIRESYHNTLSHSLAESINILVNMSNDVILLSVQDDGQFHGSFEKGFGLSIMEENVEASGGKVEFIHEPGQGFGVNVIWRRK